MTEDDDEKNNMLPHSNRKDDISLGALGSFMEQVTLMTEGYGSN